jgi:hypothetical protein
MSPLLSDVKTSPLYSDVNTSPLRSDVKKSPQHSDVKTSPLHSDVKTSPLHSDVKYSALRSYHHFVLYVCGYKYLCATYFMRNARCKIFELRCSALEYWRDITALRSDVRCSWLHRCVMYSAVRSDEHSVLLILSIRYPCARYLMWNDPSNVVEVRCPALRSWRDIMCAF